LKLLFILPLFLFSCKKDTVNLTQAQLTALRLENDLKISPNVITTRGSIWVWDQASQTPTLRGGTSLTITSDGFIIISGTNINTATYNLGLLKSYRIDSSGNIDLYF
ncbi:hypothetical protein, partial [Staphylococcus aureus]